MSVFHIFKSKEKAAQYAALPVRKNAQGNLQVCLITSRGTGKWLIPKGWPKKKLQPFETAAEEAREEAGLLGEVGQAAVGSFKYSKKLHLLASMHCQIDVYPLLVEQELENWPEESQRERRWFDQLDAAEAVSDGDLARIIRDYRYPSG